MPKMYRESREDKEVELTVSVCEIKVMMGYASIGVALRRQDGGSNAVWGTLKPCLQAHIPFWKHPYRSSTSEAAAR